MSVEVERRMEHIQHLFLSTQEYTLKCNNQKELIDYLDQEPLEFRSVSYESASMVVGLTDLLQKKSLTDWLTFYNRSKEVHSFHMEIGLGWAFAKAELSPNPYLKLLDPLMQWMVFDGIGYYYGLFKGRRTVKDQQVPEFINERYFCGFDQGLGRRLWYISKGDVNNLFSLISKFPASRMADLWRGIGIAVGYVGGNDKATLAQLTTISAEYSKEYCVGIALAAFSRSRSGSINEDIENACTIVCDKPLLQLLNFDLKVISQADSKTDNFLLNWVAQLDGKR